MHSNTSFGESAALEYEVGGSYIKVLGTWDDTTVPGANFWADIPAQPNGATVQYQLFTRNTSGGNEGNFTGFNWSYTVNDGDIQWDGLYHDTFNGYYRDPFGAVPADTDVTLRFRTTPLDVDGVAVRVYTYDPSTNPPSTSGAVDYPMTYLEDQGGYAIWTVTLDTPDTPAILYYHFVITDGLDVDYYSDDHGGPHDNVNQGGTGAASDNQGAEGFQLTVYDPAFQTPDWLQNAVVYQIFPDRFRNGDPTNDYCRSGGTTGCPLFYGDQDILLREPWNSLIGDPRQPGPYQNEYGTQFYGGDLQGLIDKLDYLKAAGFDTIYTTPIFDGSSNHRYDTDDYMAIDPALGTQADFDALIAALDARGMHLIVDGVFNHTSSDSVYFDRYHRYSGNDGACESLGSTYRDWYNFYNNDAPCGTGDYEGWFGYDSLAVLQDGSAEVRDFIYRDANSVVDTWYDRGVAGWRFDVADEISHNWWRDFRPYAKADAPNGPLVGEVWPDASNFLLGDQLDSVMNYRFRKNVLGFVRQAGFADNDNNGNNEIISLTPSQFDRALMSVREDYPAEATAAMLNLLDSHDTNRLRYLVDILGESDAQTLQRQKLAAVFQYTYMGAPMVYYGDEVALDSPSLANGVNGPEDDPYNRAPYPWADEAGDADAYGPADADMLAFYSRLAELRGDYDALRGEEFHTLLTGDTTGDSQDNTTYAYARPGSPAAIVALNPGSSANTASIPVDAYYGEGETLEDMLSGDTYVVTGGAVEVALPARSGVLLLPATTTITIEKVVVGDASGVSQWEFTDPYGNPFSLPAAGGSTLLSVFPSAPLSVSETVPNDWSATAACDTGATGTDSVEVTLDVGQDVTCTFTNTQDAPPSGDLTITKVVAGTPPGADWAFSGDLGPFNLPASGGGATYSDQAVGDYTINETYVPGWATTTSCSPGGETGDRSVSLTLDDGEAAECVFTNTLCQPGTYDDMAACVSTDAGYYTDTPGAVAQLACVPGYYQPAGGQTSCLAANPGYYVATSAAISQTECSPGKYQSNYAAVQCNLADPGYYAAGTAAPTQTACSPGSYQPNSGQESCLLADAGYYVDTEAATAQTACPAGTTSPPASDSVDDCVSTTADLTIVKATDPAGGAGFPFTLDPGAVTFADKWGSNGVGQGDFNGPFGIAVDAAGNVYVADTFAYRVQKFDAGGNFILMWGRDVQVGGVTSFEICLASESCKAGTNGSGNGEFNLPHGVAVDSNGNVYVSDSFNHRIQKFDANGNYVGQWGGSGGGGGQFNNPTGMAVDGAGNVYVADSFNNRVQKFDAAGNFLLAWGYNVIDGGGINFEICTPADTCQAGSSATGNGAFDDPFGVAVYGTTVYVADTFNHRVQVFDTNGNYLDQWGSEGNGNSQFDRPYGLAADAAGNIYVADSNNARMQKFDGDGDTLGQWGVSGLGDGQFYYNTGVAVSGAGVYVSDYNFHRVQRFSQTGATLDDGQSHTFAGLAPGAYLVSELVPAGWVLDDIDCGAATVTESGNTVSVTLAAGDAVTCTFSNVEADTAAPETTIDTGPTGTVSSPDATFTFSSEAGATFQCRLDGGAWEQCDDGDAAYTGLSDGSHTFEVYACDAAGNCDATPATRTWTIDTTAPTVTINQASGQADPTSASPIAFTVVFSEPVTGFATGDVTLSGTAGATTAAVSGGPTTYNVAVSGMTGSGTVIATVPAAVADDAAGNDNTASTSTDNQVTYNAPDTTPPDTTITTNPPNPSNSSSATFTFSGSDPGGSGVASFECRIDGGSWTACTSPQTYVGLSDGSHTFEVRAIDAAGNTDPTPAGYTWLIDTTPVDTTPPAVTINQASGQTDPTGSSPINFTVVFSEPVIGFATGDVTLSGTAGATTATVTPVTATTYNVAVSGMTGSGTVIATVAAAVADDAAGNDNTASTSTDNTVTYDVNAPDTTILSFPFNPSTSSSATFTFSGTDSGGSGVASFECRLDGGSWTVCTSPQTYVGLSDGSHTFEVRAIDAAGNTDPTPASYTWLIDTTSPSVTINQASGQADPTSSSPINFTVVFSEPASGFATGDVTLSGTAGATTATVTPVTATTYNVAVSGMTGSGTVIATVAAGVAEDAAGNDNTASTSTDNQVTYNAPDTTAPTVTINQASGQTDPTGSSPINFTVVFSEPVSGFATGDVTLSGTTGATTAAVTGGPTTYNVAVSGMTGSGTVIATVAAAVADDAAGNDNTASTSTDNTVTYDVNAPDTTILSFPFNPSSSSSATFTFSGTDSGGSGVASFECRLDGGSWTACTSPQNYSGLSDGSHTFEVRAIDAAGNTDPTPASYTWLIDTTSPSVTINQASGQADPTGSSPINFTVVFSEPVSGFATGDVTLSGTAGATTAAVTGGPTTYNVAVSGMTNSGTVIATVAAGVAEDVAGNDNTASTSTDNTVTYNAPDTTAPTVTINQASGQADPTSTSPIAFTVVFSEPVTGFATGDVTLSGTAGATTATVTPVTATTYNVAVSGMTNSGTVIATVAANVAQDAAGNGNAASTSTDNQVTYNAPAPAGAIYVTAAGGNAPGAGAYQKNDILKWNGSVWSVWFDGATRGLPATADIMAFDVDNDAARSAWIVIRQAQKLPGVGKMEPTQIAYYNGTTWSRFFDGRDVGLLTTGERINGLEVLPGSVSPIGSGCLYYLLISTVAGGGVPVGNSNVNFTGEDVLGFCMTSMGTNTAGTWHIRFEGQAEGLQKNNNLGLSASANGATLYFTVKQNFTGDGGLIRPSQLFSFSGGVFSGPLWKAADHGLTQQVDGIDVVGSIP